MPRQGLRPHLWKVQGQEPHDQYVAWQKARAQANFRKEVWLLTFEDFQRLWQGQWHRRGRGNTDLCMTRDDPQGAWDMSNCDIIPRVEQLRRQKLYKSLAAI